MCVTYNVPYDDLLKANLFMTTDINSEYEFKKKYLCICV